MCGEREALFHLWGLGYEVVTRPWNGVRMRGRCRQELLRRMARGICEGFRGRGGRALRMQFDVVSVYLQPDGTHRSGIEFDVRKGGFEWD